MPYPENCPSCSGPFRNTGSHFTARRHEGQQRVLLELGCQITAQRFWWDFTEGRLRDGDWEAQNTPLAAVAGGSVVRTPEKPGHGLAVVGRTRRSGLQDLEMSARDAQPAEWAAPAPAHEQQQEKPPQPEEITTDQVLRRAFARQFQVDRLMLRHMQTWAGTVGSENVGPLAQSATEATYERLALVLFGCSLAELLAESNIVGPPGEGSAAEKLAQQREKARLRARQRRALLRLARAEGVAEQE